MTATPNIHQVVLARESRGLNQAELAERIGIAPTHLSKIERGDLGISDVILKQIARTTDYPLSFFFAANNPAPDSLAWRRREKVAQRLLAPIHGRLNLLRFQADIVAEALNIPVPALPAMELSDTFTPAAAARKLAKHWAIPAGPVANLTGIMESQGIITEAVPFGTERVDSRTIITGAGHPVICYNSAHTGDRQRFSLAYQLGHLLLHTFPPAAAARDIGHEANLFAAELLMPERAMRKAFSHGVSLPLLAELKPVWGVSMIALLYRADDLGFLTPNQKRYLVQQFNQLRIRRREPAELDVPSEKPALFRQWLAALKKKEQLSVKALAARLHLASDEFISRFGAI